MVWETEVQSQVESYHRLKKWNLMPPCLALSMIRWGSREKWSNPGNGVAPSPTPRCSSYWKGSLRVTLDYSRQLYFYSSVILVKLVSVRFYSLPITEKYKINQKKLSLLFWNKPVNVFTHYFSGFFLFLSLNAIVSTEYIFW